MFSTIGFHLALIKPVQFLVDIFKPILVFFHESVGFGWGVAIIALTICVRAAMLPLVWKQLKSMQALQRLNPQMKEIRERFKDDRQRQQQEMVELYRKHKVNPFGSCLPLILQFPVFIGLYYTFQTDLKREICGSQLLARGITSSAEIKKTACEQVSAKSGEFLFIPDLTDKATGAVLVVLIGLYIGSQLLSSVLLSRSVDPMQRKIMILLPLFMSVVIINFPAGLIVYWITTNFWTAGQQYVVKRFSEKDQEEPSPSLSTSQRKDTLSSSGQEEEKPRKSSFFDRILESASTAAQARDEAKGETGSSEKTAKPSSKQAQGQTKSGRKDTKSTTEKRKSQSPPPPPGKKGKRRTGKRK